MALHGGLHRVRVGITKLGCKPCLATLGCRSEGKMELTGITTYIYIYTCIYIINYNYIYTQNISESLRWEPTTVFKHNNRTDLPLQCQEPKKWVAELLSCCNLTPMQIDLLKALIHRSDMLCKRLPVIWPGVETVSPAALFTALWAPGMDRIRSRSEQ